MDNTSGTQATLNPAGTTIPSVQPRGATYGSGVSATRPSDEYLNGTSVNPYLEAARDFFHQLNDTRGDIEPEDRFVDQKYERRNAGNRGREYIRSPYRRRQQRSYEYDGDDSSYSPGPYREGPRDDTRYDGRAGREEWVESEHPNSVAGRNPRYSPLHPWDVGGQSRLGRDGEGGGRHVSGNRAYTQKTRVARMDSPTRLNTREDANFDVQPDSPSIHPGAAQHYQMKSTACPTCGGVSYHTHGQYVYSPPPVAVQPPLVAPTVTVQPPLSAHVVQPTVGASPMNIVGTFVPDGRPATPSATFTPATWSQTPVGGGQHASFVLATPPNGQQATPK